MTDSSTMCYDSVDWFGKLMETRRADGEPHIASYGQVDTKTQDVTWHEIDHCEHDGIGGFATVLKSLGHEYQSLPGDHPPEPKGLKNKFKTWATALQHANKRNISWNDKWKARYNPDIKHTRTQPVLWKVLTHKETKALDKIAVRNRAATGNYLLSVLSNIVGEEFITHGTRFEWMVPTNLRGALSLPNPLANHCSAYSLDASSKTTPTELQKRSRELYLRGDDWAMHWTVKFMGKYLPNKLSRFFQRDMERKNPQIGCFTNLGYWRHTNPSTTTNEHEGWIVVPTMNESTPIGAGCITWNGRLSVALQIHPSLQATPTETQILFDQWIDSVLSRKGHQD